MTPAPARGDPESFDAIVIGSGFGGALAAARIKQLCKSARVLVLERGMPYPPRGFPRRPAELRRNFWDPESSLYGLFELWSFEHARALVSSGLGGGSLIYANVLLPKPRDTFKRPGPDGSSRDWPIGWAHIHERYQPIAERLGAWENALPGAYRHGAAPAVPKTEAFLRAAREAGLQASDAPIAVSFADRAGTVVPGGDLGRSELHDRPRRTCTLVGECDMGCNEGAKNTLDHNYLDDFLKTEGATIRTCCEVTSIAQAGGGYRVAYRQHLAARDRVAATYAAEGATAAARLLDPQPARTAHTVTAPVVVLAAGALGSTRLLLASRAGLPALSPRLGHGFSSNGDLITFARDCTDAGGTRPRDLASSRGPVITAYAEDQSGGQRVWVEDAGGPDFSEWGWQLGEAPGDLARAAWSQRGPLWARLTGRGRRPGSRVALAASELFGDAHASAATLPMLSMGLDQPGGRMRLDRDALTLDWDPADSQEYFDRAEGAAERVAVRLGGRLWPHTNWMRERLRGITTHPLGGCPMGDDAPDGVVDKNGEVFGCPGLFVADGSVMPGPVGPNPSLTIAAVAQHIGECAAYLRLGAV